MKSRATGKWILAGEHTVIRGGRAVVFPLASKTMSLEVGGDPSADLDVLFTGPNGQELQLLFWGALDRALELCKKKRSDLRGNLVLESHLPIGAGLGASAALTVIIGKLCLHRGWLDVSDLSSFCKKIEDLFHGESSGVDIAVCLREEAISFARGESPKPLNLRWKPKLFLSYSGQRGVTKDCVQAVQGIFKTDFVLAQACDEQMKAAVKLCEEALGEDESPSSQTKLVDGIKLANKCFVQWGLTEGVVDHEMTKFLREGALAVKPTGSGRGGYILTLWDRDPREGAEFSALIPCF